MRWLGCPLAVEGSAYGGAGVSEALSVKGFNLKPILQFNECILLFSDMPAVDIDNVVSTSMEDSSNSHFMG